MNKNVEYKMLAGKEAAQMVRRMVADHKAGREARESLKAFIQFINQYRIDVSRQPVALSGGKLVACVMLIICPGATASVFLPEDEAGEQKSPEYRDYVTGLLKFLAGQIDTLNLSLIQTTITQNGLGNEEVFLAGDFSKLCDLEIMEAAVAADLCVATDEKIGWQPFTSETQERFEKVISQSYEGTMDCPGLSGLRTMGEVVEGHRYSGIFEPKGWWLMEYEGEDAGVILLNSTEEAANRLELVYMGLARRARGKGLGKVLLSRAFEAAGWLDKKVIRLAVDRENVPAIKLYRRFGFVPVAHQLVLAVMNEARRKRLAEAKE